MKTILVIEDNAEMRENISEILELAAYRVISAENGKQGVEQALASTPDLIICDIMMPVLDGYGVLHLLAKNESTARIPFIFLSAKAERGDIRRGMELGADDYLAKPFDDSELLAAVESRLRKQERSSLGYTPTVKGIESMIQDSGQDLKSLSALHETRHYKKHEPIYKEGSTAHGVFLLVNGKVKCYRTHELGKELITALVSDGQFFGYLALMEEKPYSDEAQALDDSEICFIPKDEFFQLLFSDANVSRQFIRLLADELENKEEQLLKLAYTSVRKRVAEALLSLEQHYGNSTQSKFSITISRDNLAQIAGTATETTIRTLSDFRDEGLIDIQGSTICIVQRNKLVAMRN